MRRIKSVGITVPCVVGPYTGVSMTLTLLDNHVRFNPATDNYQCDAYNETNANRFVNDQGGISTISIHKTSRLKSFKMFKVRKALPLARLSLMKSKDRLWLALSGWLSTWGTLFDSLFFGFTRKFRRNSQYTR